MHLFATELIANNELYKFSSKTESYQFSAKTESYKFCAKNVPYKFSAKTESYNFLRKMHRTNFLRKLNLTIFCEKCTVQIFCENWILQIFCVTNFLRYKFSAKKSSRRSDATQFHMSLDLPWLLVVFQRDNRLYGITNWVSSESSSSSHRLWRRLEQDPSDDVADYVLHCLQQVASHLWRIIRAVCLRMFS